MYPYSNPRTYVYVSLKDKGTLGIMKLRILNEELILHYLKCIHKCLYKREAEGYLTSAVRDVMVEARDWSGTRKGSGPRTGGGLLKLKSAKNWIFP